LIRSQITARFSKKEILMQQVTHEEIKNFVSQVVQQFNPERIILFGSYASENPSSDSDIDLHFGFLKGQAPPGMICRHLRQMEEDGLVSSQWKTEDTGPAKRVYHITDDGKEMLGMWIGYMERQAESLMNFIKKFSQLEKGGE
jgi:DNA-binding PadR family transcriptional regulator